MILYFYNYSYLRSRHSVVNERMRTLGDVEVNNVAGRKVIELYGHQSMGHAIVTECNSPSRGQKLPGTRPSWPFPKLPE